MSHSQLEALHLDTSHLHGTSHTEMFILEFYLTRPKVTLLHILERFKKSCLTCDLRLNKSCLCGEHLLIT